MIIQKPGKISDNIVLLGRRESCVYLLTGKDHYVILGGGMVHIIPDILDQLDTFDLEKEKIKQIFILHAHFDHCGIVPFFKKRFPYIDVVASSRAKELLSKPKVIDTIDHLNQGLLKTYGAPETIDAAELKFSGITIDKTVKHGDRLSCGDLTLEIIDAPGHSSCSIAVYVPQEKAMFASDATGIPFGNDVFTTANSNFDQYQQTLDKIAAYDINIHLTEHFGATTGKDATAFLKQSKISAEHTRKLMEASLARTGDVQASAQEMLETLLERAPEYFLPRDVLKIVITQMLNYLHKQNQ